MTICSTMLAAIDKRLAEKKSLEEIGCELCDAVDDPRGKALRIIKSHRGVKFLKDNADWLGYQVQEKGAKKFEPITISNTKQPEPEQTKGFDDFGSDEIVHESKTEQIEEETQEEQDELCSYRLPIPKEPPKICPCGCGYAYYENAREWHKIE